MALKTQYIDAVFHIKKVKPAIRKTFRPLRPFESTNGFIAMNNGTKPTNNNGESQWCGGQASHIKNALINPSVNVFLDILKFIDYLKLQLFSARTLPV